MWISETNVSTNIRVIILEISKVFKFNFYQLNRMCIHLNNEDSSRAC